MSHEFGWTPEQISRLTYAQVHRYLEQLGAYREIIPRGEAGIFGIMQILGYKPPKRMSRGKAGTKEQKQPVPAVQMTADQIRRYERAGYPPIKEWMKKERKRGH